LGFARTRAWQLNCFALKQKRFRESDCQDFWDIYLAKMAVEAPFTEAELQQQMAESMDTVQQEVKELMSAFQSRAVTVSCWQPSPTSVERLTSVPTDAGWHGPVAQAGSPEAF
jgi:hypothetical protein